MSSPKVFQVKNSFRFVVAAVALGLIASANASVILQSTTQITKKKILVQYQQSPTGVLQTMKIKQKRLAKWCRKHGGCTYAVIGGNNTVLATGVEGGGQSITSSCTCCGPRAGNAGPAGRRPAGHGPQRTAPPGPPSFCPGLLRPPKSHWSSMGTWAWSRKRPGLVFEAVSVDRIYKPVSFDKSLQDVTY